jgi:hypothetical protein
MKKLMILALALSLVMGMASLAGAAAVGVGFSENWQGYADKDGVWGDITKPWYFGRVGPPDAPVGSIYYDFNLVNDFGNKYVYVEDDSGIFFEINTAGYTNVSLDFDWLTRNAYGSDFVQVGYTTTDMSGYFTDGETNTILSGFFTTFNLGTSDTWQSYSMDLPDADSVWVFLALNDGEGNYGKFDNISVNGSPVPIPGAVWLLGSGLVGLVGLRRKYR